MVRRAADALVIGILGRDNVVVTVSVADVVARFQTPERRDKGRRPPPAPICRRRSAVYRMAKETGAKSPRSSLLVARVYDASALPSSSSRRRRHQSTPPRAISPEPISARLAGSGTSTPQPLGSVHCCVG